jgi:prolyl-tRNA synthetase
MRWSTGLLPTFKETPAEAEIPSQRLMLRAGIIRKLTSGVYTFLPLGFRVLRKVEAIVREEMNAAGAQELLMPILHPSELYEESGRMRTFGPELFKLHDRRDRLFALGPTHEEVITSIARDYLRSYRQLPQNLYQILIKFRDEIRPRFGVMRAREFIMKDAYSFHDSEESLQETYDRMARAYGRIVERCGLSYRVVEAESGAIGGDVNHEFMVLAESGESEILYTESGYAANRERAVSRGKPRRETEPESSSPELVETPERRTIEEVTEFLQVDAGRLVKTLLFRDAGGKAYAALVPGERELNEYKLAHAVETPPAEPMDERGIEALTGAPVGFAGPVGLDASVTVLADRLLDDYEGMIVGANRADAHLRGVVMGRDFQVHERLDLVLAEEGDRAEGSDEILHMTRGVEVGHIFKLGTKYSEAMSATYLDEKGKARPFIMGCYGFGVSRMVAAVIEASHDENGICWPEAVAPFDLEILPLNVSDPDISAAAERLYAQLSSAGLEVLLDDRDLRAGFKFKDADLIGIPRRVVLGEKNLRQGKAEIQNRRDGSREIVPLEEIRPERFR